MRLCLGLACGGDAHGIGPAAGDGTLRAALVHSHSGSAVVLAGTEELTVKRAALPAPSLASAATSHEQRQQRLAALMPSLVLHQQAASRASCCPSSPLVVLTAPSTEQGTGLGLSPREAPAGSGECEAAGTSSMQSPLTAAPDSGGAPEGLLIVFGSNFTQSRLLAMTVDGRVFLERGRCCVRALHCWRLPHQRCCTHGLSMACLSGTCWLLLQASPCAWWHTA